MKNLITHEEFSLSLTNKQYGNELTKEEINKAKENGLIVVYGASDDLIEFEGCISEEIDCYGGGIFNIKSKSLEIKVASSEKDKNKIEAVWCDSDFENTSWTYKTDIPHSKFNIYEDNDIYCIGIVFSIYDLK